MGHAPLETQVNTFSPTPVPVKEFVSAGIDYITATCLHSGDSRRLEGQVELWLQEEVRNGNECRKWTSLGYEGVSCGAVNLGVRHDGIMVRVTGAEASQYVNQIAARATNVSRLDCQSTVRLDEPETDVAEIVEDDALRYKVLSKGRWAVELRRNSNKGKTVYLGTRVSDRYMRIYDKGRESKLPELHGCWRAEAQFNNELAWLYAKRLREHAFNPVYVSNVVSAELERRGVLWKALQMDPSRVPQVLMPSRSHSDLERKMKWLRLQVAPTIRRLSRKVDREKLLEALGLD